MSTFKKEKIKKKARVVALQSWPTEAWCQNAQEVPTDLLESVYKSTEVLSLKVYTLKISLLIH